MKRHWPGYLAPLLGSMALGCNIEGALDASSGTGATHTVGPRATSNDGKGAVSSTGDSRLTTNVGTGSGTGQAEENGATGSPTANAPSTGSPAAGTSPPANNPLTNPADGAPAAGNPGGHCEVPSEAALVDTTLADQIVGTGSAASCTGDAVIAAVALGGIIRFDCGPDPVTITLDRPAKVVNDASDDVVIDGGGKVTLSGGGRNRILYMNTCDSEQHFTSTHCDNQATPRLTVQNLTFVDGNSKAEGEFDGGGAIWVRGGRFKLLRSRFFNNECADDGPDVGGAAVRVFSQFDRQPVYVVGSTFGGGEGFGNRCSNGGGIGSIDVSWSIYNSVFSHNEAVGAGGNPAEAGTPGGGSGGAIYNDGETMTLSLCGTLIEHNDVNAYGSGIFFVSNNHEGTLAIKDSLIRSNTGGGWNVLPGISMHDDTEHSAINSTIE